MPQILQRNLWLTSSSRILCSTLIGLLATKARRLKTDRGRSRPCKWTVRRTSQDLVWKHGHETRRTDETHNQVWPSWSRCRSFHRNWKVSKLFTSLLWSSACRSRCGVVVNHSPSTQWPRAQSLAPPAKWMRPKTVAISQYGLAIGGTLNTSLLDTRRPWYSTCNSTRACVYLFGCALALKLYIYFSVNSICSLLTITNLRQNHVETIKIFHYNEIQFTFKILVM